MLNELMKDAVSKLVLKDIQHELDNVKVLYEDNQGAIQLAKIPNITTEASILMSSTTIFRS